MALIVDLQMKEIQERLAEHDVRVRLTEESRAWLAKEGYDPSFGARPLRRVLQKYVESPMSVKLLAGELTKDTEIIVDVKDGKIVFSNGADKSKD